MATAALVLGLISTGLGIATQTATFIQTIEAVHNHTTGVVLRALVPKENLKYKNAQCWKRCQRENHK